MRDNLIQSILIYTVEQMRVKGLLLQSLLTNLNLAKTELKIISTFILACESRPNWFSTFAGFLWGKGRVALLKALVLLILLLGVGCKMRPILHYMSHVIVVNFGEVLQLPSVLKLPLTVAVFIVRWRIWSCRNLMSWTAWSRAFSTSTRSALMATQSATFSKTPLILKTVSRRHVALTIPFPCCW